MVIIPDYNSGPVSRTFYTGTLCLVGSLSLTGGAFGVIAKGVSSIINNTLGTKKIHELFADCVGGFVAYGALYSAAKIGFIAAPITLTSAFTLTAVSVAISILTIKVVYFTLMTFFYAKMHGNGKLESFSNSLMLFLRFSKWSQFFEGREIYKFGDHTFTNREEKEGLLLYLIPIFLAHIPGSILKLISWLINPSTLRENWNAIQWQCKETERVTSPNRFSEALIKSIVQNKEPSELDQNHPLLHLPEDALAQIAMHLKKSTDLYAFFSSCKRCIAFSEKHFNERVEGKRSKITEHFPKELVDCLGRVDQFRQMPYINLKAHRIVNVRPPLDRSDEIQRAGSIVREGARIYYKKGSKTSIVISNGITCLTPSELGSAIIAYGTGPIPFVAVHVTHRIQRVFKFWKWSYTSDKQVDSVVLFHRCSKVNGQEFWGMSSPIDTWWRDERAIENENTPRSQLIEWFKGLLEGRAMGRFDGQVGPGTTLTTEIAV